MSDAHRTDQETNPRIVEQKGPWPFATRRVFRRFNNIEHVWSSRQHRKGLLRQAVVQGERLAPGLLRSLWMPDSLNWWIAMLFALGALIFAIAGVLSLEPTLAKKLSLDSVQVNAIFFIGSIPFTIAAYLQLFQAANAGDPTDQKLDTPEKSRRLRFLGWRPHEIGWLSSALQFIGTILFNINTLDAMLPSLDWLQQDLAIWVPDFVGSILFLASGYLAFIETCHAYWAWKPNSISWWIVFINLLGCVGFMIAALFAVVLPGTTNTEAITIATIFTIQGAICFLVGSSLMLPESNSQSNET